MIFDTWGGVLSPRDYRDFSLELHDAHPVRACARSGGPAGSGDPVQQGWRSMAGPDGGHRLRRPGRGLDPGSGRRPSLVGDRVALQGNLDPSILYSAPARIREEVARVLASYGQGPGHVFNLGHGIHPDVNPSHAAALVEAVHALSPAYHGGG